MSNERVNQLLEVGLLLKANRYVLTRTGDPFEDPKTMELYVFQERREGDGCAFLVFAAVNVQQNEKGDGCETGNCVLKPSGHYLK
jgi:hypothetical protein